MTNDEIVRRAHEEFALRGFSPHTVEEYIGVLRIFLRYYENRPIETMDNLKSASSCSIKSALEKHLAA